MKGKLIVLILLLTVFLGGMGAFLYPIVNGLLLDRQQSMTAQLFLSREQEQDMIQSTQPSDPLRIAMEAYNQRIFEEGQAGFNSVDAYETPSFLLSDYGLEEEVFGVISIPSLDVELPIYLGASAENLALGAAHLSQTSLPIGGENTNCVIAGHRGWRGGAYFRDIPKLKAGELVEITNLWETLTYQVIEVKTIYPKSNKSLLIQPEQDLLTLMTCEYAPGGVKNRCLVICERVEAS